MKRRRVVAWAVTCPSGALYGSPWRERGQAVSALEFAQSEQHGERRDIYSNIILVVCKGKHRVVRLEGWATVERSKRCKEPR